MEKRLDLLTSVVSDLMEVLKEEEILWLSDLAEQKRILEGLLIELELKRLLGEIAEEECTRKSTIINSGLNLHKTSETLTYYTESEPVPLKQPKLNELVREEERIVMQRRDKPVRRISKQPRQLENSPSSSVRCMNPWKPRCSETNIELSIYYEGRMTPICRRCWEDLSKKDLEWSSL